MFDFLFGGKRKLELIRELLEQRMRACGFDDMESRLKVKKLSGLQLIGTPEGTLVTLVEAIIKCQRRGELLPLILSALEAHRRPMGEDTAQFVMALELAKSTEPGKSVASYCFYRLSIEHPGRISADQFALAFSQCVPEVASW